MEKMDKRSQRIMDIFGGYNQDQIENIREQCYSKQSAFVRDYPYLEANIPPHELDVVRHEGRIEKKVREFDLADNDYKKSKLVSNILVRYLSNIEDALKNGLSFVFYGTNETGKTIEAIRCLFVAISRGYSGYYIDFRDLMQLNNEAMYGDDERLSSVMSALLACDFLVVDEVGKESTVSENVIGSLEKIIKKRSSRNLSTILVTNIYFPGNDKMEGFKERYGNSVFNAMIRNYRVFEFSSEAELRKETREDWDQIL